jgi:thiol-disulfide isomerase/thioredoxin
MDGPVARRGVLGGILGALAYSVASPSAAYAGSDEQRAFETVRHQFTILRPVKIVPDVQLTRLDRQVATFEQFRGKVLLVNFWATWCPACRTELPQLERLQLATRRENLQVIAISLDRDGRSSVIPFLKRLSIRNLDVFLDPDGRIARPAGDDNGTTPFSLYGMPVSYIVGPTGRIEGYLAGEADWLSKNARDLLTYYSQRR